MLILVVLIIFRDSFLLELYKENSTSSMSHLIIIFLILYPRYKKTGIWSCDLKLLFA